MTHKLSVTVQVDLDGRTIRILATGCLTESSQRALHPLIRRARSLTPGIHVTVDCTGAHHVEAAGVELLRWTTEHDDGADRMRPVHFLLPDLLPGSPRIQEHGCWNTPGTTPSPDFEPVEVTDAPGGVSSPGNNTKVESAHGAS